MPWAELVSCYSIRFKSFAVEVLLASRTLTQAAELLRLSWDGVQRIIDRAVVRGMARRTTHGIKRVGLDEKSFLRGQSYVARMTDLDGKRVLDLVPGQDTQSVLPCGKSNRKTNVPVSRRRPWTWGAPIIARTLRAASQTDIVHNRFHVAQALNEAVNQTRREESAQLAAAGDNTLKQTSWLWRYGKVPEARKEEFEALLEMNLHTARACM